MYFEWNEEKNKEIKKIRNVGFEDVIQAFEENRVIDIIAHHDTVKYPNQMLFIVQMYDYTYYVPFVKDETKYFLKNIIPSRKYHKLYKEKL